MTLPFRTLDEQVSGLREFSMNPQQRIRLGWESLDILVEGPARGEVCMILGRSFSGKSLFGSQIIVNNRDLPCIFFSLEMPEHQVLQRLFSQWSEVNARHVMDMTKSGSLPGIIDTLPEAFPKTIVIDQASVSLGDMTFMVESFAIHFGERPAFVVVDYLELIGGGKTSGEGYLRTEATAGALKDWAKNEAMPVFVLHQTNRTEPAWKAPNADSARGAGFTESDIVIGMWRPGSDPTLTTLEEQSMRDRVFFNVLKNRVTGRTATELKFELEQDLRFVDLSAEETRAYWRTNV